ncbi:MAG: phenylacetate--CoA ligase family protein [Anaerolineae bacterium]|nr:phenylacetate--CoA ligase family protein [Anaerolineae bacterium]
MKLSIITGLFRTLGQFHQRENWTRQQLEAHQVASLQAIREYAYKHSPFYQRFHRGLTDSPLHELPILTKHLMMEHFDDLATDRHIRLQDVKAFTELQNGDRQYLNRYWLNATSGSSGSPGIFLFNRAEWTTVLASFARPYEWAGVPVDLLHRQKIAIISSVTPWHMSAQVGATLRSRWASTLRLPASEPLESLVAKLNDWQPEALVAYASMGRILASEQLAGRLRIAPGAVFTSSEVLTNETRRLIETAWGKHLFNQYAATEVGGLGAECEHHHGLHLFEDLAIFEVVDKEHNPVPPGVYGDKVLITGLFNRTQPLIRYELSDSLRLAVEQCSSKRPFAVIDGIQGRMEDILYLPSVSGGEIAVHPIVFHQVMDTVPASGWQVVQEGERLTISMSGTSQQFAAAEFAARLHKALADQGVIVPPIKVQQVEVIPKTASGKAPLIKADRSPSKQHQQTGATV